MPAKFGSKGASQTVLELRYRCRRLFIKIVLRNVSSVNLTLPASGSGGLYPVEVYQTEDYLSNSGPYSTMFCSAQVELDKSSNLVRKDDYIHFIFPKDKDSVIGEGMEDSGRVDNHLHSEYVGILAKVVSKKDLRVYQNKNVVNAI